MANNVFHSRNFQDILKLKQINTIIYNNFRMSWCFKDYIGKFIAYLALSVNGWDQ